MKKWKAWAVTLLIFVFGVVVGAAGTVVVIKVHFDSVVKNERGLEHFFLRRLEHKLDLTDEQQEEAEVVLDKLGTRLRAFRDQHKPELEMIIKDAVAELKVFLDQEQVDELDAFIAKIKAHHKGLAPPPPPVP